MINLRYHIVSIVAVFLALGLGVALGSSFIDGAIVSQLRQQVDDLESSRAGLEQDVRELDARLDVVLSSQEQLEDAALPIIGGHRLDGLRVMMVADDGVDEDLVASVRTALIGTDARFEGVVYLPESAALDDEDMRNGVADLLSLPEGDTDVLRDVMWSRLATAMLPPDPEPASIGLGASAAAVAAGLFESEVARVPPAPTDDGIDLLEELRRLGVVRFDPTFAASTTLVDRPEPQTRYLFVSGDGADLELSDALLPLLEALVAETPDGPVPGVAVQLVSERLESDELFDPPFVPATGLVGAIRSDDLLDGEIATVDDVDGGLAGLLAAVVALDRYPAVGHYGVASDAVSGLMPS